MKYKYNRLMNDLLFSRHLENFIQLPFIIFIYIFYFYIKYLLFSALIIMGDT